jgi:peptidoglycan/LPS O-acetylase OafA/YrhL
VNEARTIPYRPDIDGLRAVAVLAVIFFHAGFPWARGGYIGVDVFFVISGFLITGIILREHRDGTFSLARFYERRARRILPALLVVLAATLLAASIVMFSHDRFIVARSAVSVLAFAANVFYWRGVDFGSFATLNYFQRTIHDQPLAHTWSLGVEEQYYLLFPLALISILHLPAARVRRILVAAALASFAACALWTPLQQSAAFYLLPTRIWELLVGGFVAWYGAPPTTSRWRHEALALLGAALVLAPIYGYDEHAPFPGVHAAAPVVGAALLIRYATGTATSAVLAARPLVFIGLISYSAYLWHQPLFAVARYLDLSRPLSPEVTAGLCVLTLVMAAATWWGIETPFRERRRVGGRALAWSLGPAMVAIAAAASVWAFGSAASRRSPVATNVVGQSALSLFTDCNFATQPTRRLGIGCLLDPSSAARPAFLVLGDSHADAIFPAFAKISRESGVQGLLMHHLACPSLIHFNGVPAGVDGCRRMQQAALDAVSRDGIRDVFLVARFTNYEPLAAFPARVETTIATYAERGAMLHIVAQVPEQPHFDPRRWARALLWSRVGVGDAETIVRSQSASRQEHDEQQAYARSVWDRYQDDPRVRIIDVTGAFCDAQTCPAGTVDGPFYADDDHVNADGALRASEAIARAWRGSAAGSPPNREPDPFR